MTLASAITDVAATLRRVAAAVPPPHPRGPNYPISDFHGWAYLRQNQRIQEHLASLGLPLAGRSVLEVGAGIGDHTGFFADRGCSVLTTEGRPENLAILRERYPTADARLLNLDAPDEHAVKASSIVYCYGVLYHLARPAEAIAFLAKHTDYLLLLETCVSPGDDETVNVVFEDKQVASQAISGVGCRPTRSWVQAQLRLHFPHVYMSVTQPWHEDFPTDWNFEPNPERNYRCVFVASREPLALSTLTDTIPVHQARH